MLLETNDTFARVLLSAASRSGDPGTISLAAQLAGVPPCQGCGFREKFCRCSVQIDTTKELK